MKNFKWDKKYLYSGVTAFCVIIASIIFYLIVGQMSAVMAVVKRVISILNPILWGFVIAYLLCPMTKFLQRRLFNPLGDRIFKKEKWRVNGFGRAVSVFVAIIVMIAMISALLWLVLPQVYFSLESIVVAMPEYFRVVSEWFERMLVNYPTAEDIIGNTIGSLSDWLLDLIKNTVLPQLKDVVTNVTTGVYYFVRAIINILVGIVVSIYVLYSKEAFGARAKKIMYAILPKKRVNELLGALRHTNKTFMGFISGKLLDSLIIGAITYIFCLIAKMPYPALLAVIIGVTNIIPFFGPFIGAIPTALIVLMDSPIKCLVFVIYIIIIQQIDGNLIGPKILGNSTGLNGFWVMFAIILAGGLFGVAGMIIGVPLTAVIYSGVSHFVNLRLQKEGMPTATLAYMDQSESPPQASPKKKTETAKDSDSTSDSPQNGK